MVHSDAVHAIIRRGRLGRSDDMSNVDNLCACFCDELMCLSENDSDSAVCQAITVLLEYAAIRAVQRQETRRAMSLFILSSDVGNRLRHVVYQPEEDAKIIEFSPCQ